MRHEHIVCECQLTNGERKAVDVGIKNYLIGYRAGLNYARHQANRAIDEGLAMVERQLAVQAELDSDR